MKLNLLANEENFKHISLSAEEIWNLFVSQRTIYLASFV